MSESVIDRLLRSALPASAALAMLVLPACTFTVEHQGGDGRQEAESASGTVPEKDPEALILEEQDAIDEELRTADLSPFTATAAHYVELDKAAVLGAGEEGVTLNPESEMPAMASIRYADEAFWVGPVGEAVQPTIHSRGEDGNPEKPGHAAAERTKLDAGAVIGLGRFYLSMTPQSGMFRVMVYDPESPERRAFDGLKWYPPNTRLQVKADWTPSAEPEQVTVATSQGLEKTFHKAGTFTFEIEGKAQSLVALAASAEPEPGDELFMPFTDLTSGSETYDIGRYLSVAYLGPDRQHTLDFNRAGSPNCDYSPYYNCPFPPEENALTVAVNAGERKYKDHH